MKKLLVGFVTFLLVSCFLLSLLLVKSFIFLDVASEIDASVNRDTIILTIDSKYMMVNGKQQEIDPGRDTIPIVIDGRILVPIRSVVESLGGQVDWNSSDRKVTVTLNNTTIELWVDKTIALINGQEEILDVAPTILKDRTMVPLRFISEHTGCTIEISNNTVYLYGATLPLQSFSPSEDIQANNNDNNKDLQKKQEEEISNFNNIVVDNMKTFLEFLSLNEKEISVDDAMSLVEYYISDKEKTISLARDLFSASNDNQQIKQYIELLNSEEELISYYKQTLQLLTDVFREIQDHQFNSIKRDQPKLQQSFVTLQSCCSSLVEQELSFYNSFNNNMASDIKNYMDNFYDTLGIVFPSFLTSY